MKSTSTIAIGPRAPRFPSWQWLGESMLDFLGPAFQVTQFDDLETIPDSDIVIFLKFLPSPEVLARVGQQSRVIFLPVDLYGNIREIHEDDVRLQHVSLTIVHSRRLHRYFSAYCNVEYLDHPLKFVLNAPRRTNADGPLIWIGQCCNSAAFVDWLNLEKLDREVWILANFVDDSSILEFKKSLRSPRVRVEQWSLNAHIRYLESATAAVDIKGFDFRSRHKPPAKSLDYAASGIPVIIGHGSSADYDFEHIKYAPLYADTWRERLDDDYRQYVYEKSFWLRENLSNNNVWSHFRMMLERELDLSKR